MWVVNCNCQVLVSHHCQFPVIVNVASCQLSTVVSCCLPQSPLSVSIVTTRCTFQLSLSGVIVSHHCQFPVIVSCQLPFVSCQFLVVTTISVNCYYHLLYLHLPLVVYCHCLLSLLLSLSLVCYCLVNVIVNCELKKKLYTSGKTGYRFTKSQGHKCQPEKVTAIIILQR